MAHSHQNKNVWSNLGFIRISPFGQLDSDLSIIGYPLIFYMTPHISRFLNVLMLTTPRLIRNEPLEDERILVVSATRNKVLCRQAMTIEIRDPTTNTDWKIILVLATGPGNPPEVRVLIGGFVWFGSRPVQKTEPRCLDGVVTQTGHKAAVLWPGLSCSRASLSRTQNFHSS